MTVQIIESVLALQGSAVLGRVDIKGVEVDLTSETFTRDTLQTI